jgi:hypothetical protein
MPNFIYTDDVPNPPNLPSTDVGAMQVNTNSISDWVNVDHFGFNTGGATNLFGGHHKQVYLVDQPAPALPLDGMDGVLYSDTQASVGPASFPAWRNFPGGSFLITGSASPSNPISAAKGMSFLSGGMIIQWGLILPLGVTGNELFATPFINNVFSITTGLVNSAPGTPPQAGQTAFASIVANPGLASFDWYWRISNTTYCAFYYMAIGN